MNGVAPHLLTDTEAQWLVRMYASATGKSTTPDGRCRAIVRRGRCIAAVDDGRLLCPVHVAELRATLGPGDLAEGSA